MADRTTAMKASDRVTTGEVGTALPGTDIRVDIRSVGALLGASFHSLANIIRDVRILRILRLPFIGLLLNSHLARGEVVIGDSGRELMARIVFRLALRDIFSLLWNGG